MAYSYYRSIQIDHTKCGSADSTNFPVLVSGTYTYLKTTGNGGSVTSSSGYDIQFYSDSALTTALKFERVAWGASTGTVEFWVKVPTLSASSDTTIYMAYGDATVTTDQQDAANTWDANTKVALHLGDGTTLSTTDSTSNALNFTNSNATATTGKVGGGASFNGTTAKIYKSFNSALNLTGQWTYQAWVSRTSTGRYDSMFSNWLSSSAQRQIYIYFEGANNKIEVDIPWIKAILLSSTAITTSTARLITVTKTSGNVWTIYINGASDASVTDSTAQESTSTTDFAFGYSTGNNPTPNWLSGWMDEIRISDVARSASWILSEYNNQNSPSTFYTVGSQQSGIVFMPRQQYIIRQAINRSYTY